MSDDPTPDVEAPEAEAPDSPEVPATDAPPPWGDDFNPERAWQTITHLRGKEKELEPHAKTFQRLQSGEDADTFRELAAKYGFEIPEDDVEEYEDETPAGPDDDNPLEQEVSGLKEWVQQQQAKELYNEFSKHLDQLITEQGEGYEFDEDDRNEVLRRAAEAPKFGPKATEEAFKAVLAREKAREARYMEKWKGAKKAPAVTPEGKGATQVPDLDDHATRVQHMLSRMTQGNT